MNTEHVHRLLLARAEEFEQSLEEALEGLQGMQTVLDCYSRYCSSHPYGESAGEDEENMLFITVSLPPVTEQRLLQAQANCRRIIRLVNVHLGALARELLEMGTRVDMEPPGDDGQYESKQASASTVRMGSSEALLVEATGTH